MNATTTLAISTISRALRVAATEAKRSRVAAAEKFLRNLTEREHSLLLSYYGEELTDEMVLPINELEKNLRDLTWSVKHNSVELFTGDLEAEECPDVRANALEIMAKWVDSEEFFGVHCPPTE